MILILVFYIRLLSKNILNFGIILQNIRADFENVAKTLVYFAKVLQNRL